MTNSTKEPKRTKTERRNRNRRKKAEFAKISKQAKLQLKKDKPVKPPPAKPIKTDLLSSNFEVLVGTGASQQMFSIHEQVVTKRSEFFRVGRQKRWNQKNEAKTMLLGEDPRIFSAYLHTVYFGPDHLKKRIEDAGVGPSENSDINNRDDSKDDETATFLIKLYLLADELLGPVTANLVIDELAHFLGYLTNLDHSLVTRVYTSTKDGSPLRMLFRDI